GHLVPKRDPRTAYTRLKEVCENSSGDTVECTPYECRDAHRKPDQRRLPRVDQPEEGIGKQYLEGGTPDRHTILPYTVGHAGEDQDARCLRDTEQHVSDEGDIPRHPELLREIRQTEGGNDIEAAEAHEDHTDRQDQRSLMV